MRVLPALCVTVALSLAASSFAQDAVPSTAPSTAPSDFAAWRQCQGVLVESLSARERARAAVERLEGDGANTLRSYEAARAYWLLGDIPTSIKTLEAIVKNHGSEPMPRTMPRGMTNEQTCYLWIGAAARQDRDWPRARKAYEAFLSKTQGFPSFQALARLYCAEIEKTVGNDKIAQERLAEVIAAKTPTEPSDAGMLAMLQAWARFKQTAFAGKGDPHATHQGDKRRLGVVFMAGMVFFSGTGLLPNPGGSFNDDDGVIVARSLAQIEANRESDIDYSLLAILRAYNLDRKNQAKEAQAAYRAIFTSDSFLAPEAGVMCALSLKKAGQEDERVAMMAELKRRFPLFDYKDE